MSYIRVHIHSVFGTKHRFPTLEPGKRDHLFNHISENAKSKNILIDTLNGCEDHVHILIKLNACQSIGQVMQLIKGESSKWANDQKLFDHPLIWARGYFATSVSRLSLNKVREYIKNQEDHHRKVTYYDEYIKLLKEEE